MKKDNIVLIGFMGSGKSTVGIRLSYRLRTAVEDTDKLIERRQNRKISDIFAKEGERYFRRLETDLLKELIEKRGRFIFSVGGGTPVSEENRPLLKQLGKVIYLRVQPQTVYERLKRDTTRPLLQCEDPLTRIRTLLDARKDAYEACADVILDVDGLSVEEIVEEIVKSQNGRYQI